MQSASNQTAKRPSSQYDNLFVSEQTESNCNPSTASTASSNLPAQNSSFNTMNTQNSLNLSWQSNNFSSTLSSSSSSHIDSNLDGNNFDSNHLNSNRSSDRSSKYSHQSQSSYENEDDTPPQLPPKSKNISVYCQLFSSYTAPKDKCYRYSVHTVQEIYRSQAAYQQVELSFNQQKQFHNNQLLNSFNQNGFNHHSFHQNGFNHSNSQNNRLTASSITTSSDDSMFSIDSFNSDSSKETNLLPLPPKKPFNHLTIPEKPEAYRYKIPAKFQHHHSNQLNDQNLNEIKTAKLKHFDTLDFGGDCRSDSPVSLQKSER